MSERWFAGIIGWMKEYRGLTSEDPTLIGGGDWPDQTGKGGEVCNFLTNSDGFVYGHFETVKRDDDEKVRLERLGARKSDQYLKNVNVIWLAITPDGNERAVVGWYTNATIYRQRQTNISDELKSNGVVSFVVRTEGRNATLLPKNERTIRIPSHGKGLPGRKRWWYPQETDQGRALIKRVLNASRAIDRKRTSSGLDAEEKREKEFVVRLKRDRQPAFRKLLLAAYGYRCPVTGCAQIETLEAAHVVRYANQGPSAPANGVLFRADLHRLFDAGLLTLAKRRGSIVVHINAEDPAYSILHGSKFRLPSVQSHRPRPENLLMHAEESAKRRSR